MDFTPRQLEVLKLLARDYTRREIAEQVKITQLTTLRMIQLLAAKLDVKTTEELRQKAREIT